MYISLPSAPPAVASVKNLLLLTLLRMLISNMSYITDKDAARQPRLVTQRQVNACMYVIHTYKHTIQTYIDNISSHETSAEPYTYTHAQSSLASKVLILHYPIM